MDTDDLVQIEYWIEETAEFGRYVRTDPMALAIAIRILSSDSMKGMFPRGVIVAVDSESSPDGEQQDPRLPPPPFRWHTRLSNAWAILNGRAIPVHQTKANDAKTTKVDE